MSLKANLIAARASFDALAAQCNATQRNEPEIDKIRKSFRRLATKLGVKQRNPFSPEATSAIIAGLGRYGLSSWAKIKNSSHLLAARTPKDISDKVRNLLRTYRSNDGDVPGLSQVELEILEIHARQPQTAAPEQGAEQENQENQEDGEGEGEATE